MECRAASRATGLRLKVYGLGTDASGCCEVVLKAQNRKECQAVSRRSAFSLHRPGRCIESLRFFRNPPDAEA